MATAIILSENELQERINEAVQQALTAIKSTPKSVQRKTNLDIREAVGYLNSIGYKCSVSNLQKHTMNETAPFEKFGRRLIFNADDLTKWVEAQKTKKVDIAESVSRSANLKLNAK